jgi:hypothetical protein
MDTSMASTALPAPLKWSAAALAIGATVYAGLTALIWLRFGRPARSTANEADAWLDRVMPDYDVVERHHVSVAAPAAITFAAACDVDLMQTAIVRAIFKAREAALGARPDTAPRPRGIVALTRSMGWGVLAEEPGREIALGAVTKPWEADVVFEPLPPDRFAAFTTPGYVKIAWTLRADAVDASHSIFRTETRAVATDATARAKFRRYWSLFSPGIRVIRWSLLRPLKSEAERRATKAPA